MLLALHTAASSNAALGQAALIQHALQQVRDFLEDIELNPVLAALLHDTMAKWACQNEVSSVVLMLLI